MTMLAWLAAIVSIALVFPPSLRFVNGGGLASADGSETVDRSVVGGSLRAVLFSAAAAWALWPSPQAGDTRAFALAVVLSSAAMGVVTLLGMVRSCTSPYRTRGGH